MKPLNSNLTEEKEKLSQPCESSNASETKATCSNQNCNEIHQGIYNYKNSPFLLRRLADGKTQICIGNYIIREEETMEAAKAKIDERDWELIVIAAAIASIDIRCAMINNGFSNPFKTLK